MKFTYGKQELRGWEQAQEVHFLLTNGLGGYVSTTAAFSVPRCDQGILVAAVKAPNERVTMVHRLSEVLRLDDRDEFLSTQVFADGREREDGFRNLSMFAMDGAPVWTYDVSGVRVERRLAMAWEKNTSAVIYTVENTTAEPCTLEVTPQFKFAPKEDACDRLDRRFTYENGRVTGGGYDLYILENNTTGLSGQPKNMRWQLLSYSEDAKDGRPESGLAGSCCVFTLTVEPGRREVLALTFSTEEDPQLPAEVMKEMTERKKTLMDTCKLRHPIARELHLAADAYIARRDSTGGKTILAGYPLFSDWGRDTMIALSGCCLSTGRYEDAKSILRTFLAYEQDGLVPNLFPEGGAAPMYNTVDAALLLIDCVWQYYQRTGDTSFVEEAYPVMKRIIAAYKKGTRHSIFMDEDGLISAGGGLDQVTWMDVCVQGILPTPRHGKPVEINAYWYNALKVMEVFSTMLGKQRTGYGTLAEKVKKSFVKKFYLKDKGYLKDVLSGTSADEQIRCNQIWAVSMSFGMLTEAQEKNVVNTVYKHLYTPCGLRTLSPEDKEYHPHYGGEQLQRDLAYHQGTVWPFPMGAFYRAYMKVQGNTPAVKERVLDMLEALMPMLRQGCVGQLPEIYDGGTPVAGKGCFAQAWSVGELLRVYEEIGL